MNDVSLGTYSSGITLIVLNSSTFAVESATNYNSSVSSFNPATLISDIGSIATGKYVLVGIKDNGYYNLSSAAYTAL